MITWLKRLTLRFSFFNYPIHKSLTGVHQGLIEIIIESQLLFQRVLIGIKSGDNWLIWLMVYVCAR